MVGIPFRACVFLSLTVTPGQQVFGGGGRVSRRLKQMAEMFEPSSLTVWGHSASRQGTKKGKPLTLLSVSWREHRRRPVIQNYRPPLEQSQRFYATCCDEGELHKVTGVRRPKSHTCVRKSPEVAKYNSSNACFLLFMLKSSSSPPPLQTTTFKVVKVGLSDWWLIKSTVYSAPEAAVYLLPNLQVQPFKVCVSSMQSTGS